MRLPWMAGISGTLSYNRVAVFAHLVDHPIRCTAGHLWVTIEGGEVDKVLVPNEWFMVSTRGKVIIGGKGAYEI